VNRCASVSRLPTAPLLRWQRRIVEELRGAGARNEVYYTVPAPDHPDRRLLVRRAMRRIPGLRAAKTAAVTRQPWTGRHTANLDFVLRFVDGRRSRRWVRVQGSVAGPSRRGSGPDFSTGT